MILILRHKNIQWGDLLSSLQFCTEQHDTNMFRTKLRFMLLLFISCMAIIMYLFY